VEETLWRIITNISHVEQDELFGMLEQQFNIEEAFEAPGAGAYLLHRRENID